MEQHTDLQEIIEYLNPAELDYQDWVNVGMALKHEGYSVDVWDTSANIFCFSVTQTHLLFFAL